MAGGVNKVIIMGLLGADPEKKEINGNTLVNFRLATNESWVDKEGNKQERTEWHSCQMWGKRADAFAKFFSKGDGVYVEGKLQTRSWEDKEGNKRFRTEVVVTDWSFPAGKKGSGGGGGSSPGDDPEEAF